MSASRKKSPDKMIRRRCMFISLLGLILLVLTANIYFAYIMNNDKSENSPNTVIPQVKAYKLSGKTVAENDVAFMLVQTCNISLCRTSYGLLQQYTDVKAVTLYRILLRNKEARAVSKATFSSSSEIRKFAVGSPVKHKSNNAQGIVNRYASISAAAKIVDSMKQLSAVYHKPSPLYKSEVDKLLRDLQPNFGVSSELWAVANKWVGARQVVPARSPLLGSVLKTMLMAKIVKAQNAPGGTQLKLLLTLESGQRALFKPKWYERQKLIEGPVYSGKDRHNAEVAAFHLSLLLGLRRVPLTVGREINLEHEVKPVALTSLLDTFFYDSKNNTCFYGECHYCSKNDPVCGNQAIIEGALIMMLPKNFKLKSFRSPWQRTYKENKSAKWETDETYCTSIKSLKNYNPSNSPRLLDLIDAAIFDFLIDNGDRHHYEVLSNVTGAAVMFIDNGKSFGHPSHDHLDILAPLYQCCMIRETSWERLQIFTGGMLGSALRRLLSSSQIAPILTSDHLDALDRRLLTVFATVELCIQKYGTNNVLRDDGYR